MALLLRAREAAEQLALSKSEVYEMLADGRLPAVRFGKAVRVSVKDVELLIQAARGGAGQGEAGGGEK